MKSDAQKLHDIAAENERLRDVIRALSHGSAATAVRFELTVGTIEDDGRKLHGWTCVVTHPQGNEDAMARKIAEQWKVFECCNGLFEMRVPDGGATVAGTDATHAAPVSP